MVFDTARFGAITYEENQIIVFDKGIYGFEDKQRFILIETSAPNPLLKWLQSLDDGDLAFVVLEPRTIVPEYDPNLTKQDLAELDLKDAHESHLLAMVVIPHDVTKMTANLQAPLVINPRTLHGKQVITANPEYKRRYAVFEGLKKACKKTG